MPNESSPQHTSLLDDAVETNAFDRALSLQNLAATVGFDWPTPFEVIEKLEEETDEIKLAFETSAPREELLDELGDLFFVLANLARHLKASPEEVLAKANDKFVRRFRAIEQHYRESGQPIEEASLEELESAWQAAKLRVY